MNLLAYLRKLDSRRRDRRERPEMAAFADTLENLRPGDVAIDCGANVGKYAVRMAATGATVYAFEPNPAAYAELVRNAAPYENLKAIHAAVTAAAGPVTLYLHKWSEEDPVHWSTGSSLIPYKKNVRAEGAVTVEGISLAQFIRDLNQQVRLLKIDVEGAEIALINHLLDEGLQGRIDEAFVEVHDRKIPELAGPTRALEARLASMGVKQFRLDWR